MNNSNLSKYSIKSKKSNSINNNKLNEKIFII